MKILFYSTKPYELPFLNAANTANETLKFISEPLSINNVSQAKSYDAICIFVSDDCSAPVLEALVRNGVKHIAIRAVGFENVDLKRANELGIDVTNVPSYSPFAIAEHAVALMLSLNRKIVVANKQVHEQNFTTDNLIGFDFKGKTVGVIGTGKIGSTLVKIMHGFGCKLLGTDLYPNKILTELYGLEYVSVEELCRKADIISLHTCLSPSTKYLINEEIINTMKKGVMLINTSRGGCIQTSAVIKALESGQIGYFGTDVVEDEKGIFFFDYTGKELKNEHLKKLLTFSNVLVTPHQAFATFEALTNIATTTFETIESWKKGNQSPYTLTVPNIFTDIPTIHKESNLTHA
jgi:D-lactate dehydrogenase